MNSLELDTAYTALAEAIGRVGEENTQIMLATLSLSLIAKLENSDAALLLIEQAEKLTVDSHLRGNDELKRNEP
ncbi:MAG: hypothetical protein QM533_08460 [Cytophagales bacterium]|nr:hypothetical protein [Cytophagales bacterium]